MITALIRTHPGRELLTQRAIESVENSGIGYKIYHGEKVADYSFNCYCNVMKTWVNDGFFFFLDSDDFIINGAIEKIRPHLEPGKALIVQMLRNDRPKPLKAEIVRGRIGLPCIVLHHSHKGLADVEAHETGDYSFIANVCKKIPWKFVPIPLVNVGSRSRGN